MTVLVYLAVAISVPVFLAATVVRAVTYARSPLHLRWELHPIPHGGSGTTRGSRRRRAFAELRVMVPEILVLAALRKHNRRLWYRSFPFHFGLYLAAGAAGIVLAATVATAFAGGGWLDGTLGRLLARSAAVAGACGLSLISAGALALLHRRLTDPALRAYTTAGDVANLVFFAVAAGLLGAGFTLGPAGAPDAWRLAAGLLSWDTSLEVPPLLGAGIVAASGLLAYIPLTHMSHFVGKYFTYHAVRWDDSPMDEGGRIQAAMAEYLSLRPTWQAGHIREDDAASWTEIAARNPAKGGSR